MGRHRQKRRKITINETELRSSWKQEENAAHIEWEFPGFSVNRCMDNLLRAQRILEENGCIEGRIHRFLLVGAKR